MVVHDFTRTSRDADTPEVRSRVEEILAEKIEARQFNWTARGSQADIHGVDVFARLPNGKQSGIEVKNNTWGEVRLEYVSRRGEGIVGWTVDDTKLSDYVLNLWPGRYWLIDFPCLKAIAKERRDDYTRWYGSKTANSKSGASAWQTTLVPVPVGRLLLDIYGVSVLGTPLTKPRLCPSCGREHPAGTTCAGGWAPWAASESAGNPARSEDQDEADPALSEAAFDEHAALAQL
ncbi:MAG: hypothetical protein ACRDGQ_15120 [Candidatus Limnocylindrales bacterium]